MSRLKLFIPVFVFLAMAIMLWRGLYLDPRTLPSVLIDKPLPDFELPRVEDETLITNGAKVCSLAPGVIDTDMQVQLRGADVAHFPDRGSFEGLKTNGQLTSPEEAARRVLAYLARPDFGEQPVADVRD